MPTSIKNVHTTKCCLTNSTICRSRNPQLMVMKGRLKFVGEKAIWILNKIQLQKDDKAITESLRALKMSQYQFKKS